VGRRVQVRHVLFCERTKFLVERYTTKEKKRWKKGRLKKKVSLTDWQFRYD